MEKKVMKQNNKCACIMTNLYISMGSIQEVSISFKNINGEKGHETKQQMCTHNDQTEH